MSMVPENGGGLSAVLGLLPLLFGWTTADDPGKKQTQAPSLTEHAARIAEIARFRQEAEVAARKHGWGQQELNPRHRWRPLRKIRPLSKHSAPPSVVCAGPIRRAKTCAGAVERAKTGADSPYSPYTDFDNPPKPCSR